MSYEPRTLTGIHGWLAFFIVTLGVLTPIVALVGLLLLLNNAGMAAAYGDHWAAVKVVECVQAAMIIGSAVFVAWRLWTVMTWQSVRIAVAGLWLMALVPSIFELLGVVVVTGLPLGRMLSGMLPTLVRPIIYATLWTSYLLRSERVANTYARYPAEDELAVIFE